MVEDLPPFEDMEPPPFEDFLVPQEPPEEASSPPAIESDSSTIETNANWDEECTRTGTFPIHLAPFLYLRSEEELERELFEKYSPFVHSWLHLLQTTIITYKDQDRALLAVQNQQAAFLQYPTEPSATGIHPSAIPGTLWEFSLRTKAKVTQKV
jgi:hypothetical protein